MKVIETHLVLIDKHYTNKNVIKEIATLHKMENSNWICVYSNGAFDKLLEESALKLIENTTF